jgi:predicted nucleic acid-binding protein
VTSYLVDTNLPSELTKPIPDPRAAAFLTDVGRQRVFASVVTIGEIAKGIAEMPDGKRRGELRAWLDHVMRPWFEGRILPVTEAIAEQWAR